MAITVNSSDYRDFDVQQLLETVRGAFAQKNAFMGPGSLASLGAVVINDRMPYGGPEFIGDTIKMPYFGTLGEFETRAEGDPAVVNTLKQTSEDATVSCDALAFEMSRWARNSGPDDPYEEGARQIVEAAQRKMDKVLIETAATSPLSLDLYSATVPRYLDFDAVVDARAKWGDENERPVAMIVHSRTYTDLKKAKDSLGRPLNMIDTSADGIERYNGMPIVESDRVPLTSSSMGTVSSTGTGSEPVATLAGTPLGPWNLVIEVVSGTALATATIKFSTDGGGTFSAPIVTAAANVALPLIDTAKDSLVGANGATGLTVAFDGNFANVDNRYTATALLKVSTLLVQPRALAFWYSRANLALDTDKDILRHTDKAAMHLYRAACCYRRRPGSTKPGVVVIKHNVSGYTG